VNESLNFIRKNRHHELALLKQNTDDIVEEEDPPIEDIPPEVIQQMVKQLPTGYRTVFNLYVFEDKSHQEIAQLLGISVNTSTSQLHKAKNFLAQMIQTFHDNKQHPR
jgi:RNA polymerase sigma-70 factor (ECF subfamily)